MLAAVITDTVGKIRFIFPLSYRFVDIHYRFIKCGTMQREQILFLQGRLLIYQCVDNLYGFGMTINFLMVTKRFAGNGQSFLKDEGGITECEAIPLDRRGRVGPEIADLGQERGLDIRIQLRIKRIHYAHQLTTKTFR